MDTPKSIAGRYDVLETLAEDRERAELRARDRTLGREVLLVLRKRAISVAGAAADARGLREARALAGLAHPSIQRLHDVIDDPGGPVLVLEPVAGETLAARLRDGRRLAPGEVRALGLALSDALAAVHAAGAVHRDVSEPNVVLRANGSPCLTGFRLAKPAAVDLETSLEYRAPASGGPAALERSALPAHPAPEQLGGEAASARSDLFALGCVLYRALTGTDAQPELLEHGWRAPPDPARLVPEVPQALARVVTACLARSPVGRPQSAAELRDALESVEIADQDVYRDDGRRSRNPAVRRLSWVAAAGLLAALAVGGRWLLSGTERELAGAEQRGIAVSTATGPDSGASYAASFRRSHALLIGIGEAYDPRTFGTLPNAARDVRAIAQALESLPNDRFEVRLLLEDEATFDGIRGALSELEDLLEPEDRALVYYAGHAEAHPVSSSSGWLIPADGETLENDPRRTRWVPFDDFNRFLGDAVAKHVLLAMDSCYGGRLATTRSPGAPTFEERFLTQRAKVVLASGRPGERVLDGFAGGHSPFAQVFLNALRPGEGPITSGKLFTDMQEIFIEHEVPHSPVLFSSLEAVSGEFVFLRGNGGSARSPGPTR